MENIENPIYIINKQTLDLHGLTRDEAEFEINRALNLVDSNVYALEIIHGYHKGKVLKNLVRNEYNHVIIKKKINLDAARTLFVLDFDNIVKKNN